MILFGLFLVLIGMVAIVCGIDYNINKPFYVSGKLLFYTLYYVDSEINNIFKIFPKRKKLHTFQFLAI